MRHSVPALQFWSKKDKKLISEVELKLVILQWEFTLLSLFILDLHSKKVHENKRQNMSTMCPMNFIY